MNTNWKLVSNNLSSLHSEIGGGAVDKEGNNALHSPLSIINTSSEEQIETLVGKKLPPKKIRRYAWSKRNSRAIKRENAILWSVYDKEEDKTHLGIGALVEEEKVSRGILNEDRILTHG